MRNLVLENLELLIKNTSLVFGTSLDIKTLETFIEDPGSIVSSIPSKDITIIKSLISAYMLIAKRIEPEYKADYMETVYDFVNKVAKLLIVEENETIDLPVKYIKKQEMDTALYAIAKKTNPIVRAREFHKYIVKTLPVNNVNLCLSILIANYVLIKEVNMYYRIDNLKLLNDAITSYRNEESSKLIDECFRLQLDWL